MRIKNKDKLNKYESVGGDKIATNCFYCSKRQEKDLKARTEFVLDKSIASLDNEKQSEITKEIISGAKAKVKKHTQKKGAWFTISTFLISIIILLFVLYYQNKNFGVANITNFVMSESRYRYILYAFTIFIVIMLLKTWRSYVLVYRLTKKHRIFLSYKSSSLAKYYELLTPVGSGGRPYQIYYLNSRGLKPGTATAIPLMQHIIHKVTFAVISLVVLVTKFSVFGEDSRLILSLGILGLILTFLTLSAWLWVAFSRKKALRFFAGILRLLYRMKIIKDYNKWLTKMIRSVKEMQRGVKFSLKSTLTTLSTMVTSAGIIVANAILPYLIYCIFYIPEQGVFIDIFAKIIICNLAVTYIPLPGGVGIAELSFTALFSSMFLDGTLFWAILLWRVFSYYGYLLQGVLISIYDFIWGNTKNNKARRRVRKQTHD